MNINTTSPHQVRNLKINDIMQYFLLQFQKLYYLILI